MGWGGVDSRRVSRPAHRQSVYDALRLRDISMTCLGLFFSAYEGFSRTPFFGDFESVGRTPPPPLLAGSLGRHGKLEVGTVANMRIVQVTLRPQGYLNTNTTPQSTDL